MSLSGNAAMAVLRLIKPGKGSFADEEKSRKKAEKENRAFRFSLPGNKKADYSLLPGTERPCLIIRPKRRSNTDKAILYIYGGVTNKWKTQRPMAVNYAIAAGTEVWYPVYPSMTEVSIEDTVSYLVEIYRKMTERFSPEKIVLAGTSMGGQYALAIISSINRRKLSLRMPGLLIAHSPGGAPDSEKDWELFRRFEARDPLFSEGDIRVIEKITPHSKPIPEWILYPSRGDFRDAPPSYLYFGEEMLAGNAPLYKRAYKAAGAEDRLHVRIVKNMMHGFSCMPVFPESRRCYRETLMLIRELQ